MWLALYEQEEIFNCSQKVFIQTRCNPLYPEMSVLWIEDRVLPTKEFKQAERMKALYHLYLKTKHLG